MGLPSAACGRAASGRFAANAPRFASGYRSIQTQTERSFTKRRDWVCLPLSAVGQRQAVSLQTLNVSRLATARFKPKLSALIQRGAIGFALQGSRGRSPLRAVSLQTLNVSRLATARFKPKLSATKQKWRPLGSPFSV